MLSIIFSLPVFAEGKNINLGNKEWGSDILRPKNR